MWAQKRQTKLEPTRYDARTQAKITAEKLHLENQRQKNERTSEKLHKCALNVRVPK